MGNSSDLILAYFEKEIKQEHIIDPYSILLKLITVGIYVIEVAGALVGVFSTEEVHNMY